MKRTACLLAISLAAACYLPPPRPPSPVPAPAAPSSYALQVFVRDGAGRPLPQALVYFDNDGLTPHHWIGLGPDGGWLNPLPPGDFNACAMADGYVGGSGGPVQCAPVPLHQDLTVTIALARRPDPPPPVPTAWTREQLMDFQGDLMHFAPDVPCETSVNCAAARGLAAGWHWTLWFPRAEPASRARLLEGYRAKGWTHIAVQVTQCAIEDGYHGLAPVTSCDGAADRLNGYLHEVIASHLIPVCAGLGPDDQAQPGLDKSLCPVAMDDWDNAHQKDCRVRHLAETFPGALLYVEMPNGRNPAGQWAPSPDACSPSPFPAGGGEWIRDLQRLYPNFVGVLYELNQPDGLDDAAAQFAGWNAWFRDLQQVAAFETDTYWKFWDNLGEADEARYNDALRARLPAGQGFMSGGTPHAPPSPTPSGAGHYDGELAPSGTQTVNAPDFRGWAQTTTLDSVTVGLDDVHVVFDKQATWPEVSFGIQYSIGLCEKIGGAWYCSAPIELWKGKPGGGGPIQSQTVAGVPPGQVPRNWFYDGRWGIMNGYQPKPGEEIGVFVVAGDARNNISPVQERSNIVLIKLPADGTAATFTK